MSKVAPITGSSSRIGTAAAVLFARERFITVAMVRDLDQAKAEGGMFRILAVFATASSL